MEVELRVALLGGMVASVRTTLASKGVALGAPTRQVDRYYKESGFREKIQGPGSYVLRVRRVEVAAGLLTMKKLTDQDGVWEEYETSVTDANAAETILKEVGVEFAVSVTKHRQEGTYDGVEVILDHIEELGDYLELAVVTEDWASGNAQLFSVLAELGLEDCDVERRGYPTILLEREGVKFSAK